MNYRAFSMPAVLWIACACGGSPTTASPQPPPPQTNAIGSAGGLVTSADGRAQLEVPASALATPVALTLQPASGVPLDPAAVGQSAYAIAPAGVAFQVPARLRVRYLPNLRPSGSAETELRVHRLAGAGWVLDTGAPEVDEAADTAAATVTASGTFGVRWPDPAGPCDRPEDRHFDFWLGDWTFSQTQPVTSSGINTITRDTAGCRVLENFNNGQGRSVSFFSRVDNRWHQTYIDTSGNRVTMAGEFDGTKMVLNASPASRWTWHLTSPGEIRYYGETLSGGTWVVGFDSRYIAR